MEPLTPDEQWAADYLGRLWNHPGVDMRPVQRPISEFWSSAPGWLRRRASRPFRPTQAELWKVIRDPGRLGTEAVPNVPFWIPEAQLGYVLDFLLPEFGVNLQLDRFEPGFHDAEPTDFDFDEDPDHPFNEERQIALSEAGIECLNFWEDVVVECGPEVVCDEIRMELGFGRPPWLRPG